MKKLVKKGRRNGHPLFNSGKIPIPKGIETTIFLIINELKVRMTYQALKSIATIDFYLEAHLDRLILKNLGLFNGKDATWESYFKIMDKWSKVVVTDPNVIVKRAMKVYAELIKVRNSIKKKPS